MQEAPRQSKTNSVNEALNRKALNRSSQSKLSIEALNQSKISIEALNRGYQSRLSIEALNRGYQSSFSFGRRCRCRRRLEFITNSVPLSIYILLRKSYGMASGRSRTTENQTILNNNNNDTKTNPRTKMFEMEAKTRYKHDMADAQAMMMGMQSTSSSSRNQKNSSSSAPSNLGSNRTVTATFAISNVQVQAALTALDEAEALDQESDGLGNRSPPIEAQQQQEQQQRALQSYQDSIQILLLYLRQPPSPSSGNVGGEDEYDRSAVHARVQVALTQAERLKEKLNQTTTTTTTTTRQPKQTVSATTASSSSQRRRKKTEKQEPSAVRPFVSSLFSSLTGSNSHSTDAEDSSNKKRPSSVPQSSQQHTTATAVATTTATTTRTRKSQRQPNNRARERRRDEPSSQQPQPQEPPNHRSIEPNTSPSKSVTGGNQQLQHQVLDDFYVPSSTLQKTTWDDVAGLEQVKQALQESVIFPLQRPDLFQGLRRPQNLLLYGPPGTGKTLLVRATASTSRALLFQCSASSLTSKWMGDAEKMVRALFHVAATAAKQHNTPALLFLDEVDSVLSSRTENEHEASRRLKTEFMIQMEGLVKRTNDTEGGGGTVLVLACTNCPWDLDPAVLRRFPRRLFVPLPDAPARQAMLQHLLETQLKNDHSLKQPQDVQYLANELEGYSGSDIYAIASQAAFGPIREVSAQKLSTVAKLRPVSRQDWLTAIAAAPPPSVTSKLLLQYQEWQSKHNN